MTVFRHNRRQFLKGIGGATLALPFLPSLLDKASAQAAATPRPRMVAMFTGHGAASQANMFPKAETPFTHGAYTFRQSSLKPTVNGARASLSPVLTAPSSLLTDRIASKMNTLMGLDLPFYQGHHKGGYLGNHCVNTHTADSEVNRNIPPRPTIDQILATSEKFYEPSTPVRLPSMQIGASGACWGWSSPKSRSGDIIRIPTTRDSNTLFKNIYVAPQTQAPKRPPSLNYVHESYKRLHDGAFGDALKISANDRRRLQEHMEKVNSLIKRMSAVASCEDVRPPAKSKTSGDPGVSYETIDYKATIEWYQIFNDIIVAAFQCGTSRIATIHSEEAWSPYSGGSWHQNIAHTALDDPNTQAILVEAHRQEFESLFLDLVTKLDVEEADGRTYLDNSLIWWVQESGFSTHDPISMPIVTAGSAAGFFETGKALDYRRLNGTKWNGREYTGLLYGQWLANVCMAMGLSKADYQITPNDKGYSNGWRQPSYAGKGPEMWPDALFSMADDPLPGFGKSA